MAASSASSAMDSLIPWLCSQLESVFDISATEDVARYILSIEEDRHLEDYLADFLDQSNPERHRFVHELIARRSYAKEKITVYRKNNEKGESRIGFRKSTSPEKQDGSRAPKQKFVPLLKEGQTMLPGRHRCECQAARHGLVGNCLKCGRIVCQQEGSGPCHFCGRLVCTKAEKEVLAKGGPDAEKLRKKLHGSKVAAAVEENRPMQDQEGLKKALEQRNRLIEFDRTAAKRTQVIDDECDYFASETNRWLTSEERARMKKEEESIHAERHASRLTRKLNLDLVKRCVVEQRPEPIRSPTPEERPRFDPSTATIANPHMDQPRPIFQDLGIVSASSRVTPHPTKAHPRVQDAELLRMSDEGMCLSVRQPWAQLLVAGIKKHEGRSWYTPHRGRLWISSGQTEATTEEIKAAQDLFRYMLDCSKFPEKYPAGCLLGCVDLMDCLPQEEYREKFPEGEVEDAFVLVCENARELPVRFPLRGRPKVFQMDSWMHQAASRTLQQDQFERAQMRHRE